MLGDEAELEEVKICRECCIHYWDIVLEAERVRARARPPKSLIHSFALSPASLFILIALINSLILSVYLSVSVWSVRSHAALCTWMSLLQEDRDEDLNESQIIDVFRRAFVEPSRSLHSLPAFPFLSFTFPPPLFHRPPFLLPSPPPAPWLVWEDECVIV